MTTKHDPNADSEGLRLRDEILEEVAVTRRLQGDAAARELLARFDLRTYEERKIHLAQGIDDVRARALQQRYGVTADPVSDVLPWWADRRAFEQEFRDRRSREEKRLCLDRGISDDRALELQRKFPGSFGR